MRKFVRLIYGCFLVLFYFGAVQAHVAEAAERDPHAVHGVMDLAAIGWSLEKDGTVALDGEWAFYWNRLLEPAAFTEGGAGAASALVPAYVQVPKEWHEHDLDGSRLSNQGYATYRLLIKLSPDDIGRTQGLYISSVATAYNLWIDGVFAASNGRVGTSGEDMVPRNYAKVVTFRPDKEEVELVLQVSNFVQRKGGLWTSIRLGDEQQIGNERDMNVVLDISLASSLAILGLYHLVLFLLRRKDKSPLFLGGLCLAFGIRSLFVGETIGVRLFPAINWEWGAKMEYLSFILGTALLTGLVYCQYPGEMKRVFRNASFWISLAGALMVLATPARIYTYTMQVFSGWILLCFAYTSYIYILAFIRKREASIINFLALILCLSTALNDILYYNRLVSTGDTFAAGLVGALLAQAFILSMKFSRSFKQVEKLSGEMSVINETLEDKIKERTVQLRQSVAGLQKANGELAHMEASRRRLMSGISHELGTPLTSIQGYVKAMLDGVVDPGNPKYLSLIYEKTQHLDRMIGDLLELSKLESRQVAFHFETLQAEDFFHRLFGKYELELETQGLELQWIGFGGAGGSPEYGDRSWVFRGDSMRMEQVVSNLLSNARKFTPSGGKVRMMLEFDEESNAVILSVTDTGAGIAEEDLPYIFDRFYRGKRPKDRPASGTGLGLAIAKEIVEAHGGVIGAASREGEGSTFYFKVPAHRGQSEGPQAAWERGEGM